MQTMLSAFTFIGCAAFSYLLGSISFAIIISRAFRQDDVRNYGSGNAGMTNVLRTFGKNCAILTLIGDFAKGIAAVTLSQLAVLLFTESDPIYGAYIGGIFALLGHIYPVFFGFRGGKGVMTCAGIAFVIDYRVFLILLVVFLLTVLISRIVSLGSIAIAVFYPLTTYLVCHFIDGKTAIVEAIFAAFLGAIVVYMHRSNIKRLLNGTENRFGGKKSVKRSA